MAPKRARVAHCTPIVASMHPFLTFSADQDSATERCNSFLGRLIHHGRRIDWRAVATLRLETEMTRLMHTPPYSRIFSAEEPTYKELVCEFFSTFELSTDSVSFRLGRFYQELSMKDFGIALGIWTVEETETKLYTNAVRDFQEKSQVYWDHIAMTHSVYQSTSKASGIYPALRYLHFILAHTITSRKDSVGVVNAVDVAILSNIYRGIPVDLTRVFARLVRDYATDTRKQALGLGPFITRVARYLGIDLAAADLTLVGTSTAPVDTKILRNMGMAIQVDGTWVPAAVEVPPQEPPSPPPPQPPQPESPQQEPLHFVPKTAFEKYSVARMDRMEAGQRRLEATLHSIQLSISELTQRFNQWTDNFGEMIEKMMATPQQLVLFQQPPPPAPPPDASHHRTNSTSIKVEEKETQVLVKMEEDRY